MFNFDKLKKENEILAERIKTVSEFYKTILNNERQKYSALLDDYDELKTEFAALNKKIVKIHNERGSGRKPISEEIKQQIIEMRSNGIAYQKIADTLSLSIATVYKATSSKKHNERGTGRKPISEKLKQEVIEMRINGATYRQIANVLGLAIGTVHKTVNAPVPVSKVMTDVKGASGV